MKKLTMLLALAAFAIGQIAWADTAAVVAQAKKTADEMFAANSGATISESFGKVSKAYSQWKADQLAGVGKTLKFGPWWVSHAIDKRRFKDVVNGIDPTVHPLDKEAAFDNLKLWRNYDIPDGVMTNLRINDWIYRNIVSFIYREIESSKDQTVYFTILPKNNPVYLNGELVCKADNKRPDYVELKLKKGVNRLVVRMESPGGKRPNNFQFAPYADIALPLANNFHAKHAIYGHENRPISNQIPSMLNSSSNEAQMDEVMESYIPRRGMYSAGEIEKKYNALKGVKGQKANVERIALAQKLMEDSVIDRVLWYNPKNVRAALEDMSKNNPKFDKNVMKELADWEKKMANLRAELEKDRHIRNRDLLKQGEDLQNWATEALLKNNPLIKDNEWVFIKRSLSTRAKGLPANWQGNTSITRHKSSHKDEMLTMKIGDASSVKPLIADKEHNVIADLDVDYDGKRVMFSTIDEKNRWQLCEVNVDDKKISNVSPRIHDNIDVYDGIYLPDGKVMFLSTACHVGVPCVGGSDYVANIYTMDPKAGDEKEVDKTIRQLTYEQDADWMPVVMENGRILYTRWEYVDNSHYFSRIVMHMNPDGTAQSAFYGSTSYWPNSLFYCRPIPGDPNKFVGIVSGHHGIARAGELHLFDVSKGTKEEQGRVHRFPNFGREYVARTLDELVFDAQPLLLHPYPLSEKYIMTSMRPSGKNYGIYLVDAFDNMVPVYTDKDADLFEPMPLAARKKPNAIMDKTDPDLDYGYVFLNDIYKGEGLKDVPRGTVKALRVLEYFYAYRNMGSHDVVSNEGSWDIKRIHGTVPVEPDGSALFKMPANRPMAIQPLDKDGKALALMRTWFTVMPGETQSCVGCHEGQGMTPSTAPAMASRKPPSQIKEFVGPVRGYSFIRDVQPVLDKYCVGCHDGSTPGRPVLSRDAQPTWHNFPRAYLDLNKYCRRSGPECNQNMLVPMEFNADTSELMQLLKKGHHGVKLDKQSMDILITWMDLNVPCIGTWQEVADVRNKDKKIPNSGDTERMKFLSMYANRHDDPNKIVYDGGVQKFQKPGKAKVHEGRVPTAKGFPMSVEDAAKKRAASGLPKEIIVDMGNDISMRLTLIPAGEYVQGSNKGFYDEGPAKLTKVKKPFYMGQFEVTNKQYSLFDPKHDSGYQDRLWKDHVNRGYPSNLPNQPVIRITWNEANEFCDWLSKKAGVKISLPTEAQWEWAARAGSDKAFWFGDVASNYSPFENLCDFSTRQFVVNGIDPQPVMRPNHEMAFLPCDKEVDDGNLLATDVGQYAPNPFGLYDINGNVSEWTSSDYTDSIDGKKVEDKKVARGGSWRDRANWSRVTMRRDYHPWQKVYNVGFRVVIDDAEAAAKLFKPAMPLPEKTIVFKKPLEDRYVKPTAKK